MWVFPTARTRHDFPLAGPGLLDPRVGSEASEWPDSRHRTHWQSPNHVQGRIGFGFHGPHWSIRCAHPIGRAIKVSDSRQFRQWSNGNRKYLSFGESQKYHSSHHFYSRKLAKLEMLKSCHRQSVRCPIDGAIRVGLHCPRFHDTFNSVLFTALHWLVDSLFFEW